VSRAGALPGFISSASAPSTCRLDAGMFEAVIAIL
jgi:hypothetical protein